MSGNYAPFILGAYAMTALAVVALIGWVMIDYRRQQSLLHDLEQRGVNRRSARADEAASTTQ